MIKIKCNSCGQEMTYKGEATFYDIPLIIRDGKFAVDTCMLNDSDHIDIKECYADCPCCNNTVDVECGNLK